MAFFWRQWGRGVRQAVLLAVLPGLVGCGYQPLYAQREQGAPLKEVVASVETDAMPERLGQLMRNALEHRIERAGRKVEKVYKLKGDVTESLTYLGIQKDATATRVEMRVSGSFSLAKDGKEVWSGSSVALSSYSILDNQYATMVSQEAARERCVEILAEEIMQRVTVFLLRQEPSDSR